MRLKAYLNQSINVEKTYRFCWMALPLFLQFLLHKISMAQQLAYMEDPSILAVINNHDNWNLMANSHKNGKKQSRISPNARLMSFGLVLFQQYRPKQQHKHTRQHHSHQVYKFKVPVRLQEVVHAAYNHIVSVQILIYLRAPFLEELNLDSNHISTIRSLRKCRLPALQYISIADNPVQDVQTLCQMSNNLMRLDLEYESSNTIGENLSWIAKLKMTAMKRIYIESESRIKCEVVPGMIMAKFTDIQIYENQNV